MQDRTFDCFFFLFILCSFFFFFFCGWVWGRELLVSDENFYAEKLKVRSSLQLPAWSSDSLQDSWCTAAGTSRIDQVGCTVCTYQDFG